MLLRTREPRRRDRMSVVGATLSTMTDLLQPHASDREADRRARVWLGNLDRQAAVGRRHHIVPRFLLARFASAEGQLRVRSRADGRGSVRSINDLGVRDFYTAVTQDGVLDSSLESLLSAVETGAAEIIRRHLEFRAFVHPRSFTSEERGPSTRSSPCRPFAVCASGARSRSLLITWSSI